MLVLAFYLLRLGSQGLMVHTALTATARSFPRERGKALSLANLGGVAGEGLLPLTVAGGMATMGWRPVWAMAAVLVLAGAAVAMAWLPRTAGSGPAVSPNPRPDRADDRRFL